MIRTCTVQQLFSLERDLDASDDELLESGTDRIFKRVELDHVKWFNGYSILFIVIDRLMRVTCRLSNGGE